MKVYLLKVVEIPSHKNADNSITSWEWDLGVFNSVKKAEETIRDYVKYDGAAERIFGFFLYDKILNVGLCKKHKEHHRTVVFIRRYESVRSYLADGTFWCYSPYRWDDNCKTEFFGRDPAKVNLKKGDLAFWPCGETIVPCIVAETPPTTEDWKRMREGVIKREGSWDRSFGWHSGTDCYYVYDYEVRAQLPPWKVFPFFGTISKRNLSRLLKTKEWWEAGCPRKCGYRANNFQADSNQSIGAVF